VHKEFHHGMNNGVAAKDFSVTHAPAQCLIKPYTPALPARSLN